MVGNEVVNPGLIVVKFGGSILDSGEGYRRAAAYVEGLRRKGFQVIVVVSALKGVTDALIEAYERSSRDALLTVIKKHDKVISELGGESPYLDRARELLVHLENIHKAYLYLGLGDSRIKDLIVSFGERISTQLMATALDSMGMKAKPLFGREAGIITNDKFGEANPLPESRSMVAERLGVLVKTDWVPVVAGFIGETREGKVTTMGRGGSDFTATFIASSIGAGEVHLVTDVEGVKTGDPRVFENARLIPVISYDEAIELAHLGGKKFHPRTFEPLRESPIVTRVRSLESEKSTSIVKTWRKPPLKAVTILNGLELVMVRGAGMVGRLGTAARVMKAFSEAGVNIIAISQPVSETSINLVVKQGSGERLSSKLDSLVEERIIRDYEILDQASAISLVGYGLRQPGVIGEMLGVLRGHDVYMLAKGPMEVSLSVVAPGKEARGIANKYHDLVISQEWEDVQGIL